MNIKSSRYGFNPLSVKLTGAALLALLLSACDNSSLDLPGPPERPTPTQAPSAAPSQAPQGPIAVNGAAVDGPIANAIARIYRLDTTAENLQGQLLDEGITNAQAQFEGLEIDNSETGPFLIVISSDENTIDLNTNAFPIISEVSTILTSEGIGKPVYATPLTSMAIALTAAKSDDDGSITEDEFVNGLDDAADEIVSSLGFGMDSSVDIFAAPPMVTDQTTSDEALGQVAEYRTAIAGAAAIIFQIEQNTQGDTSTADILNGLADDLSDGEIDGENSENEMINDYVADDAIIIVETDPSKLTIPGTNSTVDEVEQLLDEETSETGTQTNTDGLADGTIQTDAKQAEVNIDRDNDGVNNAEDAFPNDPNESVDTDGDKIGNNSDPDDDNDGIADSADKFPLDASESLDTDGDGIGNNSDDDDDGDNVLDVDDDFPLDASASDKTDVDGDGWPAGQDIDDNDSDKPGFAFTDTDGDGIGNQHDDDDDNDGVKDEDDDLPLDNTDSRDLDGDGIGDSKDDDIDNDGVPNHSGGDDVANTAENRVEDGDAFPFNGSESKDLDGDGIGDNQDADADGDGLRDDIDPNPNKKDTDGDGVKDGADALPENDQETLDSDNDGIGNNSDNCKFTPNSNQLNSDDDALGNACDDDDDNDSVNDDEDDFPTDPNASTFSDADGDGWPVGQDPDDGNADEPGTDYIDTDGDGMADSGGLMPDSDDDNDGVNDTDDAFPTNKDESADADNDGTGDNADNDDDNDNVTDDNDAFPYDAEESADSDGDGTGDNADSCPNHSGNQEDSDQDGKGNVCDDDDDNDQVPDSEDAFPLDNKESVDSDGDGIGNMADTDDDGDGISDSDEIAQGTNPLRRDSDRDGTDDNEDNCPLVANAAQTDADNDEIGDLCDNPPSIAGFHMLDAETTSASITAADDEWLERAEHECETSDEVGIKTAEVLFIEQENDKIRLFFPRDEFAGEFEQGSINVLGQVSIRNMEDYMSPDGVKTLRSFEVSATLDSAGMLSGNVDESVSMIDATGTTTVECMATISLHFTPMPQVSAGTTLSAEGSDGGFASTEAREEWDDQAQMHRLNFSYDVLNTDGQSLFHWGVDADGTAKWMLDNTEMQYSLTANGWEAGERNLVATANSELQGTVSQLTTAGSVVAQWLVDMHAISATGKPMDELINDDWIDAGFSNTEAVFASANAKALAIQATSQLNHYAYHCWHDEQLPFESTLNCPNFMITNWSDGTASPTLASTLGDVIHSSETKMTAGWQGLWVGRVHDQDADIYAFFVGSDSSGAEGSSGDTQFYMLSKDGVSRVMMENSEINGQWSISDPMDNNTHLILTFSIPETLRMHYDIDRDNDGLFLSSTPDSSDNMNYVRIGRMDMAGRVLRTSGVNVPALDEALNLFDYTPPVNTNPDRDGDGEPNDKDAFPDDPTEQHDNDGDGTGDNADTDDDNDNVPDTEDMFPFDPEESADSDGDGVGDNGDAFPDNGSEQYDTDGDGIGNNADPDDDNDGVLDEDDADPLNPNIGQQHDTDGDTIADKDDNCVLVKNEDQSDSNNNGLGDACDTAVPQIGGLYLTNLSHNAGSQEYDDNLQDCVAGENEIFFVDVKQEGTQLFFMRTDEEPNDNGEPNTPLGGIMAADGSFTLLGDGSFVGTNGMFNSTSGGWSFDFTETSDDGSGQIICSSSASISAEAPMEINEESAAAGSFNWFEIDPEDSNSDGMIDVVGAEYGTITTTSIEVQFEFNESSQMWVDSSAFIDPHYYIMNTGIVEGADRYIISGFGSGGETAHIQDTSDGNVIAGTMRHIDLKTFDISGMPLLSVLRGPWHEGISDSASFSNGATAYVGEMAIQQDAYTFWCDFDFDPWFETNLQCDNIVAKMWTQTEGTSAPVPATSLDEIIYTPAELETHPGGGGLWAGNSHGPDGEFSIEMFFQSDDGSLSGGNLKALLIQTGGPGGFKVLAEVVASTTTIGNFTLLHATIPAHIAEMGGLDVEETTPFVFVESTLDSQAMVRTGRIQLQGLPEHVMLYNGTARDDISGAFSTATVQ